MQSKWLLKYNKTAFSQKKKKASNITGENLQHPEGWVGWNTNEGGQ